MVRSFGSLGVFDLVAVKDGKGYLIQCKYNSHISFREWNKMWQESLRVNSPAIYAYRKKGGPIELYQIWGLRKKGSRIQNWPMKPWQPWIPNPEGRPNGVRDGGIEPPTT